MTWIIEEYDFKNRTEDCDAAGFRSDGETNSVIIDRIDVFPIRIRATQKWFIGTCSVADEQKFEDIGPFDTLDECVVQMILRNENGQR